MPIPAYFLLIIELLLKVYVDIDKRKLLLISRIAKCNSWIKRPNHSLGVDNLLNVKGAKRPQPLRVLILKCLLLRTLLWTLNLFFLKTNYRTDLNSIGLIIDFLFLIIWCRTLWSLFGLWLELDVLTTEIVILSFFWRLCLFFFYFLLAKLWIVEG